MTDPKYPDGAPEWYKPYMICEFSNNGKEWGDKGAGIYAPNDQRDSLPWLMVQSTDWYAYARPVQPWTPKVGEEVIAWDGDGDILSIGVFGRYDKSIGFYYLNDRIISGWAHVARLHNEDGSCIDVSGGIEAIKTRTPWV